MAPNAALPAPHGQDGGFHLGAASPSQAEGSRLRRGPASRRSADLTLLFKALISLEGLGRQYDPEFRLVERVKPFVDRAMQQRYQPAEAVRRGQATLNDFLGLVTSMPRDLARLIKDARQGRIRVDLDLKRLDSFGDRLDKAIDRVTIGVMTASLVIGSSIVMTVPGGPTVFGASLLTLLGLLGYLMAFVNSLWVYGVRDDDECARRTNFRRKSGFRLHSVCRCGRCGIHSGAK